MLKSSIALPRDQLIVITRIKMSRAGHKEGTPRKRYKDSAAEHQEIVTLNEPDFINDYLVRIAQNLAF